MGTRASGLLAWVATLTLLALVVVVQTVGGAGPAPTASAAGVEPPGGLVTLLGRYTVGAGRMVPAGQREDLVAQMRAFEDDPAGALRTAIVAGESVGASAALERLDNAQRQLAEDAEQAPADAAPAEGAGEQSPTEADASSSTPAASALLAEDIAALRRIYEAGSAEAAGLTPAERDGLTDRHAWFGRLALAYGAADADAARAQALREANIAFVALLGVLLGAGAAGLVGFLLLGVGVAMYARGGLRPAYHPPAPGGSVYLEAFGLFLAGFLVVAVVGGLIEGATGVDFTPLLVWALLLCALWPIARGMSWRKHRWAIGWHGGRGPLREVAAGLVGYVAGLPIFFLGVGCTLLLSMLAGALAGPGGAEPPSHPIVDQIGKGGVWSALALYSLAAVWAPVVEETMFRGALYHHLRGRASALASAAVVALVFAAVHPQGWVAIPALMSLAIVFAMLREWRGSLIAPMTAHALHNGMLVTALLLALG